MTAKSGALVLIKAGDGASPEVFTTVGGLRTSDLMVNHRAMVTSNVQSGAWQQLVSNAGMLSLQLSGSGVFTDSASEEMVRAHAFAGSVNNYRFVFGNGNFVTGAFLITAYQRSGAHDGEEVFSLALESAGNVTFSTM